MHATQHVPVQTYDVPRLGAAVVLALATALLAGVLLIQLPANRPATDDTAAAANAAAVTDFRAGERAAALAIATSEQGSLIEFRAGERSAAADGSASGVAPQPGLRGRIPR